MIIDIDKLQPEDWERGRKAVEDALVSMRDSRMSLPTRGNGLVIRERDGTGSDVIRLGTVEALRIGLEAIARKGA